MHFFFFPFSPLLLSTLACELAGGKSKTGILLIVGKMSQASSFILGWLNFLFLFFADGFGVQGTDGLTVSDWECWYRMCLFIVFSWMMMMLNSDPGPACSLWNVILRYNPQFLEWCLTEKWTLYVSEWEWGETFGLLFWQFVKMMGYWHSQRLNSVVN